MDEPEIDLLVPATVGNVRVVRSTLGAVAATQNLTYEDVDDLRIAVDEACGVFLSIEPPPRSLRLQMNIGKVSLEVLVTAEGAPAGTLSKESLAWRVMRGLCDDLEAGDTSGEPWIRLTKRLRAGAT
jgi:serine/threonine-protein kinase RsbW